MNALWWEEQIKICTVVRISYFESFFDWKLIGAFLYKNSAISQIEVMLYFRVVFFKMINDVEYAPGEKASCPSGKCIRAGVNIQSGTLTDSDCYNRFILETSYVHSAEVSTNLGSFKVNLVCFIDALVYNVNFLSTIGKSQRCQWCFAGNNSPSSRGEWE